MARLKLIGRVSEAFGFKERSLKLEKAVGLRELLELPEDLEGVIILVNGVSASPDSTIEDGDEVVIMPMIGGG